MGKPNPIPPPLSSEDISRFWQYVDKSEGQGPNGNCWEWLAKREKDGYGHFTMSVTRGNVRHLKASRVSFLLSFGYWPTTLVLHHCDNPPCCNPAHLFEGDTRINSLDAKAKGRLPTGPLHWTKTHPERIRRGHDKGLAKLTDNDVVAIRVAVANGAVQRRLATQYGVTFQLISQIVLRKIWTHLP